MKKPLNDGSCEKLILKKSSGHFKISLAMFLVSVVITSVIGLLYAKQYFQYEKDFLENVAIRTIYIDANFGNHTIRFVNPADVDEVNQMMKKNFPNRKITVIPVYTCVGLTVNESPINMFAIEQNHSFLAGLEDMLDNTAYFTKQQAKTIAIEISVITEIAENGFSSSELERVLLNTSIGVSKKTPVLSAQNQDLFPSMLENPTFFVNMNTFYDIVSVLLKKDVKSVSDVADNKEIVRLSGLYVCVDDLSLVSSVSTVLTEQNYRAYDPLDAFEDFGNTISIASMVFFFSSVVLLCMTTINILLSFRSFYRVQQKDMGILMYMGFNKKRIFKMYRKNLGKKFMQITLLSSLFVLLLGMILFLFEHWLVLFLFIVSIAAFLCALYFVISRFIIYNYVNQDLLVLIRESKEFE